MSRQLAEGTAAHLEKTSGLPTLAYPFSICFWMNAANNDQNSACGWWISNNDQWAIELQASEHVRLRHWNGSAWAETANQGNAFTIDAWTHVAVIATSSTNWRVVLNGDWANSGTYTGSARTLNQPTEMRIGDSTANLSARMEGLVAHWALWDIALTEAQNDSLAAGANPLAIANNDLIVYLPLAGTASPEPDEKNNYDFSLSGSPPQGGSNPAVETSRDFNGSSQYAVKTGGAPVSASPFTICGWFRIDALVQQTLCALSSGVDGHFYNVELQTNGTLRIYTQGASGESTFTSNTVGTSAWFHIALIATSVSSRRVILNGVWASAGVQTDNIVPGNITVFAVGVLDFYNDNYNYTDGQAAHVAIWDSALSQAQIEALAAGDNPLNVGTPVAYWPLSGLASPEPDEVGAYDLTLIASPPAGAFGPPVDLPLSGGILLRPEADGSVAWTRSPALLSRDFNGSSQYLTASTGLGLTAYPVTIAGWVWLDALPGSGAFDTLFAITEDTAPTESYFIALNDSGIINGGVGSGGTWADAFATSNAASTGVWFHVAIVITNATTRRTILNGVWASSGTSTNSVNVPSGLALVNLARWVDGSEYMDGRLAHWAVWNEALSQAQVEALAAGANPLSVGTPVSYWPIGGSDSPEPDLVGAFPLTLVGSPTQGASGPTVVGPNFLCVNEETPSDAQYVIATSAGLLDTYDVPTYDDPGTDEGFIVRYRVKQLTGGAGVEARLYEATQPEFVQSEISEEGFTGDPNIAVTLPGNVVSGNLIVGAVVWDGAASYTLSSVVDDRSSTYTTEDVLSGEFGNLVVFHAIAGTSGSCTVTVTLSGNASRKSMIVHEVSGAGERDHTRHRCKQIRAAARTQ